MSRYVFDGPIKGHNAEEITAGATDSTLTSATYGDMKIAIISVTDANACLITVQNDAGDTPADGTKGIYLDRSMGPYTLHCDLSKVLIRRASGSDCVIHVNYIDA